MTARPVAGGFVLLALAGCGGGGDAVPPASALRPGEPVYALVSATSADVAVSRGEVRDVEAGTVETSLALPTRAG